MFIMKQHKGYIVGRYSFINECILIKVASFCERILSSDPFVTEAQESAQ